MHWLYAVQTFAWCAGGFTAGFIVGRAARDVHRLADAVTPEVHSVPSSSRRRWWHAVPEPHPVLVAVIVVVLGVLTVAQGLIASAALDDISRCQARYADALADAIGSRSRAGAEAQQALDDLVSSVAAFADSTPVDAADLAARRAKVSTVLTQYVSKRNEVKELQRQHPYPEPPRTACPN